MFSGIISHTGKIKKLRKVKSSCLLDIESKIRFKNNEIGSSISCSGVCLTLEKYKKNISIFYLSKETLSKTTFSSARIGDVVNLEKSLKFGTRISGHFVQGHVDVTTFVNKITHLGKSRLINFKLLKRYRKYIVEKGSVSINGVSLTIAKIYKKSFEISIIPHTMKLTNLIKLKAKDPVNIEFDILGKYIRNLK